MKKKSKVGKSDHGAGVFANTPFKGLKGLKQTVTERAVPAASPRIPDRDAGDESDLFLRAVRGARPVAPDSDEQEAPSEHRTPAPAAEPDREDGTERELFLEAMGSLGAASAAEDDLAEDVADAGAVRSASSRMRRLKRGTLRIGEELDLHGFLKDEAVRRLGHFIASAHARGLAAVLVITGKGTNSAEGPVLPGAVSAWLREQGSGMIAEFHPAPRDKGGSGAYVVFLKQQR